MQDGQAQFLTDFKSPGPSYLLMSFSQSNTREMTDANKIIMEIPLFPSQWTLKEGFLT